MQTHHGCYLYLMEHIPEIDEYEDFVCDFSLWAWVDLEKDALNSVGYWDNIEKILQKIPRSNDCTQNDLNQITEKLQPYVDKLTEKSKFNFIEEDWIWVTISALAEAANYHAAAEVLKGEHKGMLWSDALKPLLMIYRVDHRTLIKARERIKQEDWAKDEIYSMNTTIYYEKEIEKEKNQ